MTKALETVQSHACFGGTQTVYRHDSAATGTAMEFAVYTPPQAKHGPVPVLWYLSGLTCTWANVTEKAGAQRWCAQHGVMLICPDTSPRGLDLPGEHDSYDFGSGAGFYLDATVAPWSDHYRMYSYVTQDLQEILNGQFAATADATRQAITGHSMGGHGALTIALKNPGIYKSVSAFSPIVAPSTVPWGQKAFGGYLGSDRATWRDYDACALIAARGWPHGEILIDVGNADQFLTEQLQPERLNEAARSANLPLTLRMHSGYDHSYYFVASVIGDHVAHHAHALGSA